MSNYRGNIASLLQSDFAIYQREDHAKRAAKIANAAGKAGRWPDLATLQARYNINEAVAKKLLAAAKRQWTKRKRDAEALEAARAERKAMFEPMVYPVREPVGDVPRVGLDEGAIKEDAPAVAPVVAPVPATVQKLSEILAGIRNKYGDEIRQRGEQTTIPEGFVYLVTHELFAGWVKAGMTIDYELRLGTYNVSDPLSRFRFAAIKWVPNRRQSETLLLGLLATEALTHAGEWFELPTETALAVFDEL